MKGHPDLVPASARGHSEATRNKISISQRLLNLRGDRHPNWRGASRTERKRAMGNWQYKDWRRLVFARDNYACTSCSKTNTYFHADHIIPWSKDESLRYDVSNGRTLCYECHYMETFGILNKSKALLWGVPRKYRETVS